jgi:lysophospholipase L1-like esterase
MKLHARSFPSQAKLSPILRNSHSNQMKKTQSTTFSRRKLPFFLPVAVGILTSLVWAADLPAGEAAEAAGGKAIRVACVGDSITYGAGIKDRQHDSYPMVLEELLGTGWTVGNFGVSGATLLKKGDLPYFKQKAHAEALNFAPDIVVIMLGTNDSKHRGNGSLESGKAIDNWQYKADYIPDYEELIGEFRKANPQVKVYVCLPTPCFPGRWGINNRTIHDEIIPMVRQVARDSQAGIIDLNTALTGKKNLFPDTVHPNPAGAKLMAETVYKALTGKEVSTSAK